MTCPTRSTALHLGQLRLKTLTGFCSTSPHCMHAHLQEHQRLHGKPHYASSAQLTVQHTKEEVTGKTLLIVANFPRKQIGPRMSDCLITGVQLDSSEEATRKASTVAVQCSHAVQPGLLVTVTGSLQCFRLEHHHTAHQQCMYCLPLAGFYSWAQL